jgi:hypothetical protein
MFFGQTGFLPDRMVIFTGRTIPAKSPQAFCGFGDSASLDVNTLCRAGADAISKPARIL